MMFEDNGNKCGKCQNHDFEVLKKGHARDCPFKKCDCLKCRLLDARSDILQVISGKETKLKGTKKDPNCGFCQNHGIKILRKGHVRSCGFGQERHFKMDSCFDCEVHYIRNEVNRLQIKMRRAMKEDRSLSEEQKKTTREPITREEVEKVCNMARLARKKRESILSRQASETGSSQSAQTTAQQCSPASSSSTRASSAATIIPKTELAPQTGVWRPWSQHQVAAAMVAHHHHHQQQHQQQQLQQQQHQQHHQQQQQQLLQLQLQQQQQQQQHLRLHHHQQHQPQPQPAIHTINQTQLVSPSRRAQAPNQLLSAHQHLQLHQQNQPQTSANNQQQLQQRILLNNQQQLFNTLFRLIVTQIAQPATK